MKSFFRLFSVAMTVLVGAAFSMSPAFAQTPEQFYKGKTVSMMIGLGVGGGDDNWARIIARHMTRHMPGNPVFVPSNVLGAGSVVLAKRLADVSPRDGTAIGLLTSGALFEPLMGNTNIQLDITKLNWIGSPSRDTNVCVARTDAAVQTIDDLKSKELVLGGSGAGGDTVTYPNVFANVLGLKLKVVTGYAGSRDIYLAIERNEVQGTCVTYDSISREPLFTEKKVRVLMQSALAADPRLPDIPVAGRMAQSSEDRRVLELFLMRSPVGRPFAAPPDVPADRLAALRTAFAATLKDPETLAEAKRAGLNAFPTTGQDIADVVAAAYKTEPRIVERAKKAMTRAE
jgi:tripartite-type tricarboxylate transporter receptor subunit TctC